MPGKRRATKSRSRSRGVASTIGADDPLVQNILGQYYFAFGQGAGSMRVSRETIEAIRKRHLERIQRVAVDWNQYHIGVLEYMRAVGRHAALIATEDGRIAISAADYAKAATLSEKRAHEQHDGEDIQFFGDACS